MRPLKAFINKDVIKRMRHNEDHDHFMIWPRSEGATERIEKTLKIRRISSLSAANLFIVSREQLEKVNDIVTKACYLYAIDNLALAEQQIKSNPVHVLVGLENFERVI